MNIWRATVKAWYGENVVRLTSGLAFYAAFSIVPLLLLATAFAGVIFGENAVDNQIVQFINRLIGNDNAALIRDGLETIHSNIETSTLTTIVSIVALLFGATGFFRLLKDSLNQIWRCEPTRENRITGYFRSTALSMFMVLITLLAVIGVILVNAIIFSFVRSLMNAVPTLQSPHLLEAAGAILMFVTLLVITGVVYKVLPDAHVTWKDVWAGAAMTALLLTAGQYLIIFSLRRSNASTIYGAASVLTFLMIWVYITANILLFGALFTRHYAEQIGETIISTEAHEERKANTQNHKKRQTGEHLRVT